MMSKRAELELLDAISVYFHHATPGLGPDVEIYQNAEWGFRQRDKALKGMHYFDGILKRQPFVAGEVFSMADITVIGGLIFAGLVRAAGACGVRGSSSLVRQDAGASQRQEPGDDVRTERGVCLKSRAVMRIRFVLLESM